MKINWKQELLNSAQFNDKEEKLLKYSAKSLAQSWHLGALYTRWKKLKEYKEPESPQYQSSFLEWEKKLANEEFYVLTKDDFNYPDW